MRRAAAPALWLALCACGTAAAALPGPHAAVVDLAVSRWFRVQDSSGFLPYRFDALGGSVRDADGMSAANLTRQAGTAAVIADYYALSRDTRAAPVLQRTLRALSARSLPVGKGRMQSVVETTRVLSLPFARTRLLRLLQRLDLLYQPSGPGRIPSPDAHYGKAYVGSAAFALLTEVRYSRASGDQQFAAQRRAWLEGLMALRIPGAGFRSDPTVIDSSAYFDGESWLALAEYHRAFPADRAAAVALEDVDAALLGRYGDAADYNFFHWGVMAAAARYADTRDVRFLAFIRAQMAAFLARDPRQYVNSNNCALTEGVVDGLGALRAAGEVASPLARRARTWIDGELVRVQQLQIQPGQQEITFAYGRIVAPRLQEQAGEFRLAVYQPDTQVDMTAHCVSALLKLTRHSL